jgi:hypothetical protein
MPTRPNSVRKAKFCDGTVAVRWAQKVGSAAAASGEVE